MDSLFKNVLSTLKTIDICVINLFQNAVTFKAFSKNSLRQLFHLGTKESHFRWYFAYVKYANFAYALLDWLAIESPFGSTLVNAFLVFREKQWLKDCLIDLKPVRITNVMSMTYLLYSNHLNTYSIFAITLTQSTLIRLFQLKVNRTI